jgi:hypothetical protein
MSTEVVNVAREIWRLIATNDFESVAAVLAGEFILEWPQSNERIRGANRFAQMNCEYRTDGVWSLDVNRIVCNASEAVNDISETDGVQSACADSLLQCAKEKLQTSSVLARVLPRATWSDAIG